MINVNCNSVFIAEYGITTIRIPIEELIRKFAIEDRYNQTNLKNIYSKATGIKQNNNMNYLIKDNFIAIAPDTGLGLEKDLNILINTLNMEKHGDN
ncbi:MAG: hypothetical protein GX201_14095 [Clostridiales bacterium]|nr:hypothetical protein [Clostridiales bacterium]